MKKNPNPTNHIAIFKGKSIRKTIFQKEWWFSIIDVIEALTGTDRPRKYWGDLKKKLTTEGYAEVSEKIGQLKLMANDGKYYKTDCADTETMFRIIQSIPSPNAEPFKRWLAKIGYERVQEIENPELATKRTRMLYKLKGYSDDWIEKRMRGIAIHKAESSQGVSKLKQDAKRGGNIAGIARKELEKEIGRSVVSKKNYLPKK